MWLLPKNNHLLQFVLLTLMLLLLSVHNVHSQSVIKVITSDQVAKEGNDEVVIPCDYSQVTSTVNTFWNEVNEAGRVIARGIVSDLKIVNGRFSLRTSPGNADLVIAKPVRNDTNRRFQCQVLTQSGDFIDSDPPSIVTVYYLDEPVLSTSTKTENVYEGEPLTLTCSKADGDPVPTITWYKDGQALIKDALEFNIEATTAADGGNYTCKAESDQFKGENGKTSNQIELIIIEYYITVTFESEAGTATCTAKGHPKLSSVMIYNDEKIIEKGELVASVKINEEICKTNITCYAENKEVNTTEPLMTCNAGGSNYTLYALCVIPVIWILILLYFIFLKKIEIKGEDVTGVEGDKSLEIVKKYRPSIAYFYSFQWDLAVKNEENNKEEWKTQGTGSPPKLCGNTTFFFKYFLRCCFYFCGFCCIEYCEKYEHDDLGKKSKNNEGKHYEGLKMKEKDCERGNADRHSDHKFNPHGNNDPSEEEEYVNVSTEDIQESQPLTSTSPDDKEKISDQSKRDSPVEKASSQFTVHADGRGMISLKISNPMRSNGGNYKCMIEGPGKQSAHENKLCVHSPFSLEIPNVKTSEGINNIRLYLYFTEVKADSLKNISDIRWYKSETGCLLAQRKTNFTKKKYTADLEKENSWAFLNIEDITIKDAGEYYCEVEVNERKFAYVCTGSLKVEAPFTLVIPDVTTSEGINIVRLYLHFTEVKEDSLKNISDIRWYKRGEKGETRCLLAQRKTQFTKKNYTAGLEERNSMAFLNIEDITTKDAGEYYCEVEVNERKFAYVCTGSLKVEAIDMEDNLAYDGEESTILTCSYKNLESKVDVISWTIKTTEETTFEFNLADYKSSTQKEKYEFEFCQDSAKLIIRGVTVADAGVYTCEVISRKSLKIKTSATLYVPYNVFGLGITTGGGKVYRNPAVVVVNVNAIVFCEEQVNDYYTRVLLRRGKLKERYRIDLEPEKIILDKNGTRFQNLVPIVDEKKGHVILLCLKCSAQEDGCQLIQLKSSSNGEKWSEPADVVLKWPEEMQSSAQIVCIGPGHGVCLQSGKLVTGGVIKFNKLHAEVQVCAITSVDKGDTWAVVPIPSSFNPENAFGNHAQVVEYAEDQVYITFSFKNCRERFSVFSNDGCKTFHKRKLEATNTGCQMKQKTIYFEVCG